ncbi:MAG: GNAT family N-acetyltransferase [Acidimicrobiales bacterium]
MTDPLPDPDGPARGPAGVEPLDNPVWSALGTGHAHLAETVGRARRYPVAVSLFAGVERFDGPAWSDLAHLVGPSGTCVLLSGVIPAELPPGWSEKLRGRGSQMTLDGGPLADVAPVALRPLTPEHVPQMLDLVALTRPGPFLAGTIEMGRYFGHFDGDRLVSMAGERMCLDGYREISAVCTHPEARGRGLASALTRHVASGILDGGQRPILHVAVSNDAALRIYEGLGFRSRRLVEFMVVEAPPA